MPNTLFFKSVSMNFNEKYIFSASQKINVTRDATKHLERITNEHGNIVIDVNQTESSDTLYRAG